MLIPVNTIEDLIKKAILIFVEIGAEFPRLDAEVILSHVLKCSRISLYSQGREKICYKDVLRYQELIERRKKFEPVAYIVGIKEFYGLSFLVNRNVLIPRNDTELLVDHAIDYVKILIEKNQNSIPRVLDIGVGSGCIAISIAILTGACVEGWEKSKEALVVAEENNERLNAGVVFHHCDALDENSWKKSQNYNLIVSNPPYISEDEKDELFSSVKDFEPEMALFSRENGLKFYRVMAENAWKLYDGKGKIFVEIGHQQGKSVFELFKLNSWKNIIIYQDLNGLDRIIEATYESDIL